MTNRPPTVRTEFQSSWDKAVYLLDTLTYWYWKAEEENQCRLHAEQLETVLLEIDRDASTQRGAEAWALAHAVNNRWEQCLSAKRNEISVMRRLLSDNVLPEVVSQDDFLVALEELVLFAQKANRMPAELALVEEVLASNELTGDRRALLLKVLNDARSP